MRKRPLFSFFIVLLLLGCTQIPITTDSPENPRIELEDPIPFDPKTIQGELRNGLHYYVRANKKPENRCELRLVVNVGSVLEDDNQRGLAHFVEHMAFNGTKNFEKQELVDYLESIGMEFGPGINAFTSFDETVYMLQIPTDRKGAVEQGFQILEDWAHQISFEGEEIDKERGVIVEEWRQGRGAAARIRDKQAPILYHNAKYADRLPIGKKETVESCRYQDLRQFYHDWYRPDLMAVIAVGDFDEASIVRLIKKHFSSIPIPDNPRKRVVYPVPNHKETLFAIASDPEATGFSIGVHYKLEVQPLETVGDYRRSIVDRMYNSLLNQRLYELTKQESPPFIGASSGKGRFVRSIDMYILSAATEENGIERGLGALLSEAERVRRYGFVQSELDRVKKQAMSWMERLYNERDKIYSAPLAGGYVSHYLNDFPAPGIEAENALYQRYVPGIQLEEVNRLGGVYMTPQNRVITVSVLEKEGVNIPTEEELLRVFSSISQREIDVYEDTVSTGPLLARVPEPGKTLEEVRIEAINVTVLKLSNGIRVVLKPTDFQNDEIVFTSFSPGGHSLVSDEDYVSAAWATTLVGESGIGQFSSIELRKKLAGKRVGVSPAINPLYESIYGGASPKDLETMFQLIHLWFTKPKIDEVACNSYIGRVRASIANRDAMPEVAFGDTITITMSQGHHRTRPLTVEILDEIHANTSLDIYKDRFADAGDFTFFFVGNFSVESIKPFIHTYLASLPTLDREETWRDTGIDPPDGIIKKDIRKGIEPKGRLRIVFAGDHEWSIQNNYDLSSMIHVLRIKLRETLREEMGRSYDANVSHSVQRIPDEEYRIDISVGCEPGGINEMVDAIFDVIEQLKTSRADELYITKVKEIELRTYETNLKTNGYWLNSLWWLYYHQQDPVGILKYKELIDTTSAETIQSVAETYFDKENYAVFSLYPEESGDPPPADQ